MFYRDFGVDRRKNAARHKAAVTYDVAWDEDREIYGVYRNGQQTNVCSRNELEAIKLAIAEALRDHESGLGALVFSTRLGTRNVEWPEAKSVLLNRS